MATGSRIQSRLFLISLLLTGVFGTPVHGAMHGETTARHRLSIRLYPETGELEGRDRIRVLDHEGDGIVLVMSPHVHITAVQLDGKAHPYTNRSGRIRLKTPGHASPGGWLIAIDYQGRFTDPAPLRPINTDNPGYGVSGTISPKGVFLGGAAGWYPGVIGARETFDLQVTAPGEMVAVTTGRLIHTGHEAGVSVSTWRVEQAPEKLSLSAGSYVIEHMSRNGFSASTYLSPENRNLSSRYLTASLDDLEHYSRMFGPYAYADFAVVENFFPTGYGFPGYTLMGGRVLRLPFIPQTSLPHEIVHNWWGNGVLVDAASGNWCEGLATYTADYLNTENRSPAAARDYRRQLLRNFASLVPTDRDFPLSRFRERTDPVTKAIGYDKAAMVFHMLRRRLGETAFWGALKDLYDQYLFKAAGWHDLQQVFEARAGDNLDLFFDQWIHRPGAPRLRLASVKWRVDRDGGYRTAGRIVQGRPAYDLFLPLLLETADDPVRQTVHLRGPQTAFEFRSRGRPQALVGDPQIDLFRRLTTQEIPPTVNSLKSVASLTVVVSRRIGAAGNAVARRFSRAMGVASIRIRHEAGPMDIGALDEDLLFIGRPERGLPGNLFPDAVTTDTHGFRLDGKAFNTPQDVLFFINRQIGRPNRLVALLQPGSPAATAEAIVKIPHYGRYSYLAFRDGRNRYKGTWESQNSPLVIRWPPTP